MLRLPITV